MSNTNLDVSKVIDALCYEAEQRKEDGQHGNAAVLWTAADLLEGQHARCVAKQWAQATEQDGTRTLPAEVRKLLATESRSVALEFLHEAYSALVKAEEASYSPPNMHEGVKYLKMFAQDDDRRGNLIELARQFMPDDTRTLPEPWRDPAEEWPEEDTEIVAAVTLNNVPLVLPVYRRGAKIYSWKYEDVVYEARIGATAYRDTTFDAWMPMPSHPLDDPREAGRKRVNGEGEVDVEFSEDPDW